MGGKVACERRCDSGRRRRGVVEADLGSFALGGGRDFEKFARFEAEHAGENIGGELLNLGVKVANHGVVIPAGVLDRIFDLRERVLQRSKAFNGAELRIGFGESEEALEGTGKLIFGDGLVHWPVAVIARLRALMTASRVPFSCAA